MWFSHLLKGDYKPVICFAATTPLTDTGIENDLLPSKIQQDCVNQYTGRVIRCWGKGYI